MYNANSNNFVFYAPDSSVIEFCDVSANKKMHVSEYLFKNRLSFIFREMHVYF